MASRLPRGAANNRSTNRYSVEAVARAAQLLRQFNRVTPHHTTSELARLTGLSPGLVQRTMQTLKRYGLVRTGRSPDDCEDPDHYRLGLRWLQMADVRRRQVDIRLLALPMMRSIRDAVNETVSLLPQIYYQYPAAVDSINYSGKIFI